MLPFPFVPHTIDDRSVMAFHTHASSILADRHSGIPLPTSMSSANPDSSAKQYLEAARYTAFVSAILSALCHTDILFTDYYTSHVIVKEVVIFCLRGYERTSVL